MSDLDEREGLGPLRRLGKRSAAIAATVFASLCLAGIGLAVTKALQPSALIITQTASSPSPEVSMPVVDHATPAPEAPSPSPTPSPSPHSTPESAASKGDFQFGCKPFSPGSVTTYRCTVTSVGAFSAPVTISCGGNHEAFSACRAETNPLTPEAGRTASAVVDVQFGYPPGDYQGEIVAKSGDLSKSFAFSFPVRRLPSFSLDCGREDLQIVLPGSGSRLCHLATSAATADISLSCPDAPAGISCGFTPATLRPTGDGILTFTLHVTASESAPTNIGGVRLWASSSQSSAPGSIGLRLYGSAPTAPPPGAATP